MSGHKSPPLPAGPLLSLPDPLLVLEARLQIHRTQRHPKVRVVASAQAPAGARGPAGRLARCRAELRSRASPTATHGRSQAPGQVRTGRRGRGHPSGDSPAVWGESEGPGFPPSPYVGRIRAKEIVLFLLKLFLFLDVRPGRLRKHTV